MPQSERWQKRQECFLKCVNEWYGNPPTFKMDPAHERITMVDAPSGFIRMLMDNQASLFLRNEGLIVEFLNEYS